MHHVCFLTILWYSQNDNDPWEDIIKYESNNFKTFFYIFGYLLEACINILQYLNFGYWKSLINMILTL
jgi:hypothetical protein